MNYELIASATSLTTSVISTAVSTYVAFKKSNIEKYFELLLQSGTDISNIGKEPKLERIILSMLDDIAKEAAEEKLNNWKNLTIKLASSKSVDYDFASTYPKILSDLSEFDLTILFSIYSTNFTNRYFLNELHTQLKNTPEINKMYSLKILAKHYLITEESLSAMAIHGDNSNVGASFLYSKNMFGQSFLDIISEN